MAGETKTKISNQRLQTLHRLHRQIADLRSQRDRGPLQIKASQKRVSDAEQDVQRVKEQQKRAKLIFDQKQLQLSEREDRLASLTGKLHTAASNREFSTLQEQIAADKQANEVQSDEVLEILEQLDLIAESLAATEQSLADEAQEHQQRVQDIQRRQAEVQQSLSRVESELEQAESGLPAAMKGDYQRIIGAKGEEGLAAVEDESCTACYQRLTTQYIEQLRMSHLVRCRNCDAFLYFPEDRRVT